MIETSGRSLVFSYQTNERSALLITDQAAQSLHDMRAVALISDAIPRMRHAVRQGSRAGHVPRQ